MIASWRGLAIALAAAIVLAIAVIVAGGPAALDRARDRTLVPGFVPDVVGELRWIGDAPAVVVRRAAGDDWQIVSATGPALPADATAIRDALAALRGARWHRRGPPPASRRTLVVAGPVPHTIGLGAAPHGDDQAWLAVDGRGVLVDAWVARALAVEPLALRVRQPLAGALADVTLTSPDGPPITLRGAPRRLVRPSGAAFVVRRPLATALTAALAAITIVRIPDSAVPAAPGVTVTAAGRALAIGGVCPGAADLVAVSGAWGDGCIEAAAADAVAAALAALRRPDPEVVEPAVAPFELATITLVDGAVLDLARGTIAGAPVEPARIAALAAGVVAPGEVVARPATPARHALRFTLQGGGAIDVALFAGDVAVRDDEPYGLRVSPATWAALTRTTRAVRDLTPWREEPTTITVIRIDARSYARGAVLGAWRREGAEVDAAVAHQLDALVEALAAPAVTPASTAPAAPHTVTLTVDAPIGAPVSHALAIGSAGAACVARIAGDVLGVPREVCAQVSALAR